MSLTRDEVASVLGPIDEGTIAEIVATGASLTELAEAWAWINSEEALINAGYPLPSGRVAALVDLLEPDDDEE